MIRKRLKIYGERNTGTNYLGRLIALNLDVEQLRGMLPAFVTALLKYLPVRERVPDLYFRTSFARNLGWKHSLVMSPGRLSSYSVTGNGLSFITLTKNPYSWLLSMYKRPYHQDWKEHPDFYQFLTTPWRTVGRENAGSEFASPVELWNRKNASYLRLTERFPVLNLRYEDLLESPQGMIGQIAQAFSLARKTAGFKNVEDSTKGDSKDFDFYRRYYLEEAWRDRLDAESIRIINEQLERGIVDYFGYEELS